MSEPFIERPPQAEPRLVPVEIEIPAAADQLAALEDDLEEVVDSEDLVLAEDEPSPFGRSWDFDFVRERFVTGGGSGPLETYDRHTLTRWIEKALRTRASAHPVHPEGYGMQMLATDLIGLPVNDAPLAEFEASVRDALMFHPRVSDVIFEADYDPSLDYLEVTLTIVTDTDETMTLDTRLP